MAFDYDDKGDFPSERAAKDWALRNNVDLRDLHLRNNSDGSVNAGLRKSGSRESEDYDNRYGGRSDGFFR